LSLAYALDEFGRTLGLGGLSLPPQGALHMALAGGQRRLSLEAAGEELLLYMTVPVPHLDNAQVLQMLQECDLRRRPPHEPELQLARRGVGADAVLVLLVRWPQDRVQASGLHASVDLIERSLQQWLGLHA
jgi:hypothetical protein